MSVWTRRWSWVWVLAMCALRPQSAGCETSGRLSLDALIGPRLVGNSA